MSEYRRWISYIYNYREGIKTTNAGYVRIESRCGKCRITLNIKNGLGTKDELSVYMFYRRGADMIMVYTGQAKFVNGSCEYSAQSDVDNIFGSGLSINDMGGVIIYDSLDKFYGTEWDDKPIVMRRFLEHSSYVYENNIANVVQIDGEAIELEVMKSAAEAVYTGAGELLAKTEKLEGAEQVAARETFSEIEQIGEEQELDHIVAAARDDGVNEINFIEDEEIVEEIDVGYDSTMSRGLEKIFESMPGMYPFEDDDVMECVKFEPQDIGVFPMDKWQLASNSFLLHGYYTYRHLIFARRRTKEGAMCMLGVPGMFRDREKFMARMFGFENFKGIRGKKVPGYGEFGYWYMDIDMQ